MIQEFYEHFKTVAPEVAALYGAKPLFMHWDKIVFIADLDGHGGVLSVSQTTERKVHEHARYLIQELAMWARKPLSIKAQGLAGQAMLMLGQSPDFKVVEEPAAGTLNGRKRNLAKTFIVEYTS